jgi:hypothetical protein
LTNVSEEHTAFISVIMIEAVTSYEMSVSIDQTIWCNIPENSHLQIYSGEISGKLYVGGKTMKKEK